MRVTWRSLASMRPDTSCSSAICACATGLTAKLGAISAVTWTSIGSCSWAAAAAGAALASASSFLPRRSAPALRPAGRPGPGSSPRCCCLRGRRWVSDAYSRTCSFLISGVRQGRRASQRGRIVVAARQVFELYARRLQLVARVEQVCTDGAQHALRIEHIENAALTEAVGGLGHAQGRLGLAHRTLAQCLGAQSCHLQLLPGLQRLLAQLDLPALDRK